VVASCGLQRGLKLFLALLQRSALLATELQRLRFGIVCHANVLTPDISRCKSAKGGKRTLLRPTDKADHVLLYDFAETLGWVTDACRLIQ
jgi:hypothetical protein